MIISMRTGETHLETAPRSPLTKLSRWLDLEALSLSLRYHFIQGLDIAGVQNAQHQQALRARIRLDRADRLSLHAGVFPGGRFTSGWNDTGWGTGERNARLYLKQLYLSARPASGVEAEWGGLYILHGQSTEVTSYDFDGYLTGQRARLLRPESLFFEEISVTLGYLGELEKASFFDRADRLGALNYGHFLLAKELGKRLRFSADLTRHASVNTFRQAVRLETPGWVWVDALLFENYQRAGTDSGYGFGIHGQKRLHPRASLGVGFARIDRSGLNSDRFPRGARVYQDFHLTINPELSAMVSFTRAVGAGSGGLPRTRLDVALGFNLRRRLSAR
jgi:hypothetical protein